MKKLLIGFAACTLIITSCNKNEVIENLDTGNGQLTFSPVIGKQTRAAELMNDALERDVTKDNPIMLYAYQDNGEEYIKWFNDELSYNSLSSKWEITSTRFRNTAKTKFLTYWPAGNVSPVMDANNSFTGKFTYEVQTVEIKEGEIVDNQEDLIAGITELDPNKTDVVFKMRHILSQVNFGVKSYKGAQITISKITVKNIYNAATYTFKASDPGTTGGGDIIGKWSEYKGDPQNHEYTLPETTSVPASVEDFEDVITGDKYIFGDGGNAGPGRDKNTYYPIGEDEPWANAPATDPTGLKNSLMLLPQDLENAYVEFEYVIQDIDGAYVAGTATKPATGTFALNFVTGDDSGTAYLGKWEQNFRYVYIIDFTDFLNDNALTFKVDVESYPWENYNYKNENDGEVKVPVIGQPTETIINALASGGKYYMASRSSIQQPSIAQKVQLVEDITWDWSLYDFTSIKSNTGDNITINFDNVIFNGKAITLILPTGFTATQNGTALTDNKITSGSNPVVITNTKSNTYADATKLKTAVQAATVTTNFTFTGNGAAINLDEYAMAARSPEIIKIAFTGTPPTTPPTATDWTWNATTKTATYTGQ